MEAFHYAVTVEADTSEQADMVMNERVYFEEKYDDPKTGEPFDYTIDWGHGGDADGLVLQAASRLTAPVPEGEETPDYDVDDVATVCEFVLKAIGGGEFEAAGG